MHCFTNFICYLHLWNKYFPFLWHLAFHVPTEFRQMSNILIAHLPRLATYFNSVSTTSHMTSNPNPDPQLLSQSCSRAANELLLTHHGQRRVINLTLWAGDTWLWCSNSHLGPTLCPLHSQGTGGLWAQVWKIKKMPKQWWSFEV